MNLLRFLFGSKSPTLAQKQTDLRRSIERQCNAGVPLQDIIDSLDDMHHEAMQQVLEIDLRPSSPNFAANAASHKTKLRWAKFIGDERWKLFRIMKKEQSQVKRKRR